MSPKSLIVGLAVGAVTTCWPGVAGHAAWAARPPPIRSTAAGSVGTRTCNASPTGSVIQPGPASTGGGGARRRQPHGRGPTRRPPAAPDMAGPMTTRADTPTARDCSPRPSTWHEHGQPPLVTKPRREVVEDGEYAAFTRRVVRAYSRRVAAGDIQALASMVTLAADVENAIRAAMIGLRALGTAGRRSRHASASAGGPPGDGPVYVAPEAVDLDMRFVDEPSVAGRVPAEPNGIREQRREPRDPAKDGEVAPRWSNQARVGLVPSDRSRASFGRHAEGVRCRPSLPPHEK